MVQLPESCHYVDSKHLSHGFTESGGIFKDVSHPNGVHGTSVTGVSGSIICGSYTDSNDNEHGFTKSGGTFKDVSHPKGVHGTLVRGVSGNTVCGDYLDSNYIRQGFTESGGVFTDLSHPKGAKGTEILGISGSTVWGHYINSNKIDHYFTESGGVFTDANHPKGINGTEISGISGSTVYGFYWDKNFIPHGFLATPAIPTVVTFTQPISPIAYSYSANFPLAATSTSGGTITYASSSPSVISVTGKTATIRGVGTATLTARVAATGNYPSASVNRVVTVNKITATVTFTQPVTPVAYAAGKMFLLEATSTSGGTVTYSSSNPNVITVAGYIATVKGKGSAIITAKVAATANYNAAAATRSVTVK